MLLDKISPKNQIVSDRFYRALYAKLLDPAAMSSSKVEMFISLVMRATKSDVNLKRLSAFSKRLFQVALQQPPQLACGYLFLLSEVLKARPPFME
ncbi:CCAAT/enhancer-binding protein zeta [Euphorbia peplus]|nr:CCAAT/enhancer-binding protein zeta [Euphorbia peplus]